jgi:hypothetical protein
LKLSAITLLVSVGVLVVVATLAVGYKTVSTASMNPTKTLRDE